MAQKFIVEGKDGYVLSALCQAQSLDPPSGYTKRSYRDFVVNAGGRDNVAEAIRTSIDNKDVTNIGVVIDANDAGIASRQDSIVSAIRLAHPTFNQTIRVGKFGWTGEIKPGLNFGLWIMPNNNEPGYLEHFLTQLIEPDNPRLILAQNFLEQAIAQDLEGFKSVRQQKALLSLFLALQEEPGMNYPTAVAKGIFNSNHPLAQDFITWFRSTFRIG